MGRVAQGFTLRVVLDYAAHCVPIVIHRGGGQYKSPTLGMALDYAAHCVPSVIHRGGGQYKSR